VETKQKGLNLPFQNGFFDGILGQPAKPFITERLFCPDYRFQNSFQTIFAGFTKVPVGKVEAIPVGNRITDNMFTHIAGEGLHTQTPYGN
jgi:hypothetical protein